MITLELNSNEADVLADTIRRHISDLGHEIADTDQQDYRDVLKERKAILTHLLGQLEPASTS